MGRFRPGRTSDRALTPDRGHAPVGLVEGRWHGDPQGVPPTHSGPPGDETQEHELARLLAHVQDLEDSEHKLNTERDILRAAAECFAGETNW